MSDVEDLGRQLASGDRAQAGVALHELIAQGTAATPALLAALASPDAETRTLAMEGLAAVADPDSEDAARRGLADPDGRVRSLAAVVLNRLGAADALDALRATLDDWPDLLHADMSKSAYELAGSGPAALAIAIELLHADDWATRSKGAFIARRIVESAPGDPQLAELGKIIAGYDVHAESAHDREPAAAAASRWLEERSA